MLADLHGGSNVESYTDAHYGTHRISSLTSPSAELLRQTARLFKLFTEAATIKPLLCTVTHYHILY